MAPLGTCNPTPAPQESLPCRPVQREQLNRLQQPYVPPEVSLDRPHLGQQHPTSELLPQTSPQAAPAPPMGTTESKTETQTAITINNLQQDLKRHSELLRNHTTMNQVDGGSPYKLSSIGFHTETVITILMVLAVIALAGYATIHCLQKGLLCPNIITKMPYLASGQLNRTHDVIPHNARNAHLDAYYVNPMPPSAPRLTILPGEFVDGRCWAADTRPGGYGGGPASCPPPPTHQATPHVFPSPANRPAYVIPKEEKCG